MGTIGTNEEYLCEISGRSCACKGCDVKIGVGEARVARVRGSQRLLYHPMCLFQLFDRISPNGRVIQSTDALVGFSSLSTEDKIVLEDLVSSHLAGRVLPDSAPSTSNQLTSTPVQRPKKRAKFTHDLSTIVISDDDETDSPKITLPILPNLLEGVKIPEGPERTYDECSVCLDPPVHPVKLPCSHIFCYLCAKGLVRSDCVTSICSMCRQDIPVGFLESAAVLRKASQELNDTPPLESTGPEDWQWFYEGKNGWWRFETRNNDELEENLRTGNQQFETMICGHIYVMDMVKFEQYQKDRPQRKRKIRRDLKSMECKGVAGLGKRSWNKTNSG